MIEKITKIKNCGVFNDFTWSKDLDDFKRYNLLYGWNATGKTTLSNLLRRIQRKEPFPKGDVEIQISGEKVDGSKFDTYPALPEVRVFNKIFIEKSVFKGENRNSDEPEVSPIFFLGEESATAREMIETLDDEIETLNEQVASNVKSLGANTKSLKKLKEDQARQIKNLLTSPDGDYQFYNTAKFNLKSQELEKLSEVDSLILGDKVFEKELARLNSTVEEKIDKIVFEQADLDTVVEDAKTLCKRSAVAQIIEYLDDNPDVSKWVGEGRDLHKEKNSTSCLYCSKPLTVDRLSALEQHFSKDYKKLETDIESKSIEIEQLHTLAENLVLPKLMDIVDCPGREYPPRLDALNKNLDNYKSALVHLKNIIENKTKKMFETVIIDFELPEIEGHFLEKVNESIDFHNSECDNFQEAIKNTRKTLESSIVAESLTEYTKLTNEADQLESYINSIKENLKSKQELMNAKEVVIRDHLKPAKDINADLASYLGRDDLQLSKEEDALGYKITRNGAPALGLSEGEKTAIAFIYFLVSLRDKSFDLKKGIVVIDDPVSSMDANSLFNAFSLMKTRTCDAKQLFILTHNFGYFRLVKGWLKRSYERAISRGNTPTRAFYNVVCSSENGKRKADLTKLDSLLMDFDSEYHYIYNMLRSVSLQNGNVEEYSKYYPYPNLARKLIETLFAIHKPTVRPNLTQQVEGSGLPPEKATRIIKFLHNYSHAAFISEPGLDPTILAETPKVLENVFELVEDIAPEHYKEMEKLIGNQLS